MCKSLGGLNLGLQDLGWWPVPLLGRCGLDQLFPGLPAEHLAGQHQLVLRLDNKLLHLTTAHGLLQGYDVFVLGENYILILNF